MAAELKKAADNLKPKEETPSNPFTDVNAVVDKINPQPKEQPKAEAVPTTEEAPKEPEPVDELSEPEFSLDELETPEQTSQPVDIFKKLGGALEFGEIKDESEFIAKVNELKKEREDYRKAAQSPYDGIPASLKDAVEAAKIGGDWYSLIGLSSDYSKADPVQAFEYEYELQLKHRYQKADGTIDYDKMDADIDAFPEAEKVMRGNDIIRQKVAEQTARKNQVLAQAQKNQQEFNSKLADSTKNVNKFFPKDRYGVNFEAKHIDYIYSGITSRNLIKKHLGNLDESVLSRLDTDKLARTIAAAELVGNISEFRYKQGQVDKARELLKSNTNAQLETPAVPARPSTSGDKPITPQERLSRFYEQMNGQGRL